MPPPGPPNHGIHACLRCPDQLLVRGHDPTRTGRACGRRPSSRRRQMAGKPRAHRRTSLICRCRSCSARRQAATCRPGKPNPPRSARGVCRRSRDLLRGRALEPDDTSKMRSESRRFRQRDCGCSAFTRAGIRSLASRTGVARLPRLSRTSRGRVLDAVEHRVRAPITLDVRDPLAPHRLVGRRFLRN